MALTPVLLLLHSDTQSLLALAAVMQPLALVLPVEEHPAMTSGRTSPSKCSSVAGL